MDKKKENEKLVQVMAEYSCNRECNTQCEKRGYCHIKTFAENLVDQGYGNVKQAVKEFAKQLKENYCNLDYLPSGDEFCEIIDDLVNKSCNKD